MTTQVYYTVYQITNLINGKIYVGAHKSDDPYDNYMGSGKLLNQSIEKYGIENFQKDILFFCESDSAMFLKEAEIVNEEFIARNDTYNIKLGGYGGFDHIDFSDPEYLNKLSKAAYKQWENPEHRDKMSENMKEICNDPVVKERMCRLRKEQWQREGYREKLSNSQKESWKDPEKREKRIKAAKEGSNKPETKELKSKICTEQWKDPEFRAKMVNKRWVYSLSTGKTAKINKDDPVPEGWGLGRGNKLRS